MSENERGELGRRAPSERGKVGETNLVVVTAAADDAAVEDSNLRWQFGGEPRHKVGEKNAESDGHEKGSRKRRRMFSRVEVCEIPTEHCERADDENKYRLMPPAPSAALPLVENRQKRFRLTPSEMLFW